MNETMKPETVYTTLSVCRDERDAMADGAYWAAVIAAVVWFLPYTVFFSAPRAILRIFCSTPPEKPTDAT